MSCLWMVLVAVGAFDEQGFSVDLDQSVFDADVAESDFESGGFCDFGIAVLEDDVHLVLLS